MGKILGKREGGIIGDSQVCDIDNYIGVVVPFTEIRETLEREQIWVGNRMVS